MRKNVSRLLLVVLLFCGNTFVFAQDEKNATGFNGVMRSHNKIYVVMAVCVTILIGLIFYLVRIDRKVSKKESVFNAH